MEWIRPVIISLIIVVCLIVILMLLHSGRCRSNIYKLGNNKSRKLDTSDEDLSKALTKVYICNSTLEDVISNRYKSRKL